MSETASTGEATATTPATTEATPAAPETPSTETTKTPDEYEAMVKSLREEAAANRVKGREKADAAKAAVTAEFEAKLAESNNAHEATKQELAETQYLGSKVSVALDALLPADQVARVRAYVKALQGSNTDELKAHAQELNKLFNAVPATTKAVDRTQGLGASSSKTSGDPFADYMTGLFDNQ